MSQTAEQVREILREKIPEGLVVPEHTADQHFYRFTPLKKVYESVTAMCGILDNPHLKKWAARLAVEHIDKNWAIITPENKQEVFGAAVMAHVDFFHDAGDVGTEGHGIVDDYLKAWMNSEQPPDIRTLAAVNRDVRSLAVSRSAEAFCRDFEAYPIASEMRLAHPKYQYGGTLDSLMMVRKYVQKEQWPCTLPQHYFAAEVGNPNIKVCPGCATIKEWELCIVDWKSSSSIDKVEYAMQTSAYWYALNFLTRRDPKFASTGLRPKEILIVKLDKRYAKYEVMRVVNRPETFRMFLHASKLYKWLNNGRAKLSPLIEKRIVTL
jgi:hypothetical protein